MPRSSSDMTLLFLHGNAGNLSDRLEIVEIFRNLPVNLFFVDWRGYGKSQGNPSEGGLYSDALASYKYLVEDRKIPCESVIVYGKSLGANVAVDLASRVKIGALVCDSPFTSATELGSIYFPFIPIKLFDHQCSENLGIPPGHI